jgi:sugar fermentation stimulation protein A
VFELPTKIYSYSSLKSGILVSRYKRFFADIELTDGSLITAHCPNTGPMIGVCEVGCPVLASYNPSPRRKLAYTWEAIEIGGTWVGVNTSLPNRVVKLLLENRTIDELAGYEMVRSEVPYGEGNRSRIDFLLTGGERPIYLEVKNTTLAAGTVAMFPDTESQRGQKHLEELMAVMPTSRAIMLYFINRSDCTHFAPGKSADRRYTELLQLAIQQGLEVLPCRFDVSVEGLSYLGLADLSIE